MAYLNLSNGLKDFPKALIMVFLLLADGHTHLAVGDLVVHLPAHMVDVVVHHRQGDADREDCDHREGDGRVGHEAISLEGNMHIEVSHNREGIGI